MKVFHNTFKKLEDAGRERYTLCVTEGGVWNFIVLLLISAGVAFTYLGKIGEDAYNSRRSNDEN